MKIHPWIAITVAVLLLIILLISIFIKSKEGNCPFPELDCGFLGNFAIRQTESSAEKIALEGTYEEMHLKIKQLHNLQFAAAENYQTERISLIRSLYRELDSPYPGMVTESIHCEDGFKPVTFEHGPSTYYLLYATDRLTYGICSWELIKYQSVLFFRNCTEGSLYQFEFFMPLNGNATQYIPFLETIRCKGS